MMCASIKKDVVESIAEILTETKTALVEISAVRLTAKSSSAVRLNAKMSAIKIV